MLKYLAIGVFSCVLLAAPAALNAAEPKPKPPPGGGGTGGNKGDKGDKGGKGEKGDRGDRGGRDGRHGHHGGHHGRGGWGSIYIGPSDYGYRCPRGMRWSYRRERCVWD